MLHAERNFCAGCGAKPIRITESSRRSRPNLIRFSLLSESAREPGATIVTIVAGRSSGRQKVWNLLAALRRSRQTMKSSSSLTRTLCRRQSGLRGWCRADDAGYDAVTGYRWMIPTDGD